MRDLLLVVPSRGRPQNIKRLRQAMRDTCRAKTDLLVGLDMDDPTRAEYYGKETLWTYFQPLNGEGVVGGINRLALTNLGSHRFIGHIGDDNVPRTEGWDQRVIEALAEVPMCFGNDLYPRSPGSLCCHIFMRSELVRALGYMGPPAFRSMFVDNVWMAWGQEIGIRFLPDVVIEHMHPGAGKAPLDETYLKSAANMAQGREAYDAYMASGFAADIAKIRALQPA